MPQAAVAAKGPIARLAHYAGRTLKTSLAVVGVASIGAAYYEYKTISPVLNQSGHTFWAKKKGEETDKKDEVETKKKVLVIPFNRLKIVDRKKPDWRSSLQKLDTDSTEDKIQEVEIRELVDLIHAAASDPEISALYGVFGHGSTLMASGWADLEEVRNALRVFRESHRRHAEPNFEHNSVLVQHVNRKPMYAYTDTFASLGDPGNKDYYLASIFTHIHMQKTGELNLFGSTSQQIFFRGLLEKYGVNVHVFKHGKYKNFPNRLTEWGLNRAHRENVTNILEQINQDVCQDIETTRSKALSTSWLRKDGNIWKRIQNAGTFPARTAWKSGLIDYIPRRSPLFDLIEANLGKDTDKDKFKKQWKHHETDFDRFSASEQIDLKEYAKKISKKKKAEERLQRWRDLSQQQPEIGKTLSSLGIPLLGNDGKRQENIALLHVDGGIADGTAAKIVKSLRKISKDKDTKCVVVRVTSPGGTIQACETISQELKALKVPVVFSFGNVSASGGYYIASSADRIFASKKTVTGSIGVFGIRPDFTDFIARYGVTCEHVSVGELSAIMSPFHPMTRRMKESVAQSIDRYYKQFKGVVAKGRGLSMDAVEEIGQGRVWTGDQGKTNGLVDEIGGLYRAIAYAKRVHTSGDAQVVVWPKKETIFEKIMAARATSSLVEVASMILHQWAMGREQERQLDDSKADLLAKRLVRMLQDPTTAGKLMGGVMMASDENTAINLLLQDSGVVDEGPLLPDDFWR